MFHDTVMTSSWSGVIIGLAWRLEVQRGRHRGGLLGPLDSEKADPGTTNFVPRPDWYFYFLFYLLRIFSGRTP